MKEICQKFKSRMKEKKISNGEMAAKIGRSPAALSSFLNGRDELDFYNISLLGRELYADPLEYKQVMKEIIVKLTRPDNIKCSIEFASFHEYADILEELINVAENHRNRALNCWGKIYRIHLQFLKKETCGLKMAYIAGQSLMKVEEKNDELFFFQKWMVAYGNYNENNFEIMPFIMGELEQVLGNVQNEYLKRAYATRLNLLCGNYKLFQNKLSESREHYEMVLSDSPSTLKKGHAFHGLGISYMYEDKEKAYGYMKEALGIFNTLNHTMFIENAKQTINTISNYYGDDEFYAYKECTGVAIEVARRHINNGDTESAKVIFESINTNDLNIENKSFYFLYKGILNNDVGLLYMSVMYFKEYKNKLYAILPCKELLKRSERKEAIYAAYGEVFDI